MSPFQMKMIAALANAVVVCGLLNFFTRKRIPFKIRIPLVFVIYAAVAYIQVTSFTPGGKGLLSFDFTGFDLQLFLLYLAGALAFCLYLFLTNFLSTKIVKKTK